MTAEELAEWRILDANDAFGERRQDARIAKLTAHLVASIPFREQRTISVGDYRLAQLDDKPTESDEAAELERFDMQSRAHNHAAGRHDG